MGDAIAAPTTASLSLPSRHGNARPPLVGDAGECGLVKWRWRAVRPASARGQGPLPSRTRGALPEGDGNGECENGLALRACRRLTRSSAAERPPCRSLAASPLDTPHAHSSRTHTHTHAPAHHVGGGLSGRHHHPERGRCRVCDDGGDADEGERWSQGRAWPSVLLPHTAPVGWPCLSPGQARAGRRSATGGGAPRSVSVFFAFPGPLCPVPSPSLALSHRTPLSSAPSSSSRTPTPCWPACLRATCPTAWTTR